MRSTRRGLLAFGLCRPGSENVRSWAQWRARSNGARRWASGLVAVVLAGVCGALREVEDVPPIGQVIDLHGGVWRCEHGAKSVDESRGVTLVAVDEIISTPGDKAALAARTGTAVVDMESHAFVKRKLRARTDVARDPRRERFAHGDPAAGGAWVDHTRRRHPPRRAMVDLVKRPRLVPHVASAVRRSNRVLPLVGVAVAETVKVWVGRGVAAGSGGDVA